MPLHRLTSITLGVPDVSASSTFMREFGLTEQGDGWFATRDGGNQLLLESAPRRTLQRFGVGASDPADLTAIAARVTESGLGAVVESSPERLVLREPVTGLLVDISVVGPYGTPGSETTVNRPGAVERSDVPAASVLTNEPVRPSNLTHAVMVTPDQPTTLRFFVDVVGFEVSDQIPGIIAFTRCGALHHNLAIQAGPAAYPHHIAFEMDNIDDVVRGGQFMVDQDPERHAWGIGRHAIGSNWFWYLRDPSGLFVEYTADIDRITTSADYRPKDWVGHEFLYSYGPKTPRAFLEPPDLAELLAG